MFPVPTIGTGITVHDLTTKDTTSTKEIEVSVNFDRTINHAIPKLVES
jgi:hypothetical protein